MYLIKLTSQSALEVDGRITGTLDEHKKYFDYLKAGNGDKAYSILIDHLMMPLNVVKPENKLKSNIYRLLPYLNKFPQ